MKLFIAPHDDDQVLFGAFTLMREQPLVLVVTDSWKQLNRGENITAEQREAESNAAMNFLRVSAVRGRIRDDVISEGSVRVLLSRFSGFDTIYAPAVQGGNPDHDLIGRVAKEMFGNMCIQYTTYTPTELYTTGTEEIVPTEREAELKKRALLHFESQIKLPATAPHFTAVEGRSEWFI